MESREDAKEEKLRSFESLCREHSLSITPQRVAIYKELISSEEHPSAVTIFNKVREYYSNISLDTVNRTLLTFHKIGLAKIVESTGEPKRFDPNLEPYPRDCAMSSAGGCPCSARTAISCFRWLP